MIWLLTDQVWQPVADRVQAALDGGGHDNLMINAEYCRDMSVGIDGRDLVVLHGDDLVELPRAVLYLRDPIPYPSVDAGLGADELQFVSQQWQMMLRGLIAALHARGVAVLNPPAAELVDEKTAQLISAAEVGFATPPAIHTATAGSAYAFTELHGDRCASKPFAPFVRAANGGTQRLLTNVVSGEDLRRGLGSATVASPTIVQPFVAAPYEHRVVVVGDRVFSARTARTGANAVDVRRLSPSQAAVEPGALPAEVASRCVALVQKHGLFVAAIDLLETKKQGYVFLDLNPGGHFFWVEQLTGAPICETIADLLTHHAEIRGTRTEAAA